MRLNQNYFLNHFASTLVMITSMTDPVNYFMQKHYSLRKLNYHPEETSGAFKKAFAGKSVFS